MSPTPTSRRLPEQIAQDAGFSLGEGNIDALGQFFTIFHEQTINVLYRGRTAAQTFGVKKVGDWTTERIAFKLRELTANAALYDDWTRAPYAAYNYGWDVRDTLRMEWASRSPSSRRPLRPLCAAMRMPTRWMPVVLNNSIWTNEFFWNGAPSPCPVRLGSSCTAS